MMNQSSLNRACVLALVIIAQYVVLLAIEANANEQQEYGSLRQTLLDSLGQKAKVSPPKPSKQIYNTSLNQFLSFFGPGVHQNYGKTLTFSNLDDLYAYNTIESSFVEVKNTWYIAASPLTIGVSPDFFSLLMCRELCRGIGGYPFAKNSPNSIGFASAPSQADYCAAQVCLRALWTNDPKTLTEFSDQKIASTPFLNTRGQLLCKQAYKTNSKARSLCYRTVLASSHIGLTCDTLPSIGMNVAPSYRVFVTDLDTMDCDCRTESYLAGALCPNPGTLTTIPGTKKVVAEFGDISFVHEPFITLAQQEQNAAQYSCMVPTAKNSIHPERPRCWFYPENTAYRVKETNTPIEFPRQGPKSQTYQSVNGQKPMNMVPLATSSGETAVTCQQKCQAHPTCHGFVIYAPPSTVCELYGDVETVVPNATALLKYICADNFQNQLNGVPHFAGPSGNLSIAWKHSSVTNTCVCRNLCLETNGCKSAFLNFRDYTCYGSPSVPDFYTSGSGVTSVLQLV